MKSIFLTGLLAVSATAAPSMSKAKRFNTEAGDSSTVGNSAVGILSYALVLEHLEDAFYKGGLANFTAAQFAAAGFDATVYRNIQTTAADEANHVAFLSSALAGVGAPVPAACQYSFPYTDPKSFVAVATILEGVGVSAYLGAAAYISDPDYLTAAGSILTVEARHASYLRAQINEAPFPAPYDLPLDFNQVYSLAAPFFVSCPATNPNLGLKAFPRLSIAPASGPIHVGSTITLQTNGYAIAPASGTAPQQLYAAFITPAGAVIQPATPLAGGADGYTVVVPPGVAGQSYVLLTACADKVSDDTTIAGPALLEVS